MGVQIKEVHLAEMQTELSQTTCLAGHLLGQSASDWQRALTAPVPKARAKKLRKMASRIMCFDGIRWLRMCSRCCWMAKKELDHGLLCLIEAATNPDHAGNPEKSDLLIKGGAKRGCVVPYHTLNGRASLVRPMGRVV